MASYSLLLVCTITITFGMSNIAATIQDIAPNELRGQLIAINYIIMMLTSGLTPTAVALVTDQMFVDPAALPWSMALVGGVFGSAGLGVALLTAKRYAAMRLPTAAVVQASDGRSGANGPPLGSRSPPRRKPRATPERSAPH